MSTHAVRTCRICGLAKPIEQFKVRAYGPDGSAMRQRRCRSCKPQSYQPAPRWRSGPLVDAEPIREWLQEACKGTQMSEIAVLVGISERALARILHHEQTQISFYNADNILTRAGRPDLLATLYPLDA